MTRLTPCRPRPPVLRIVPRSLRSHRFSSSQSRATPFGAPLNALSTSCGNSFLQMTALLVLVSRMIHRCLVAAGNGITDLACSCSAFTRHEIGTETMRVRSDFLKIWLPALQFLLGIAQDLSSFGCTLEWLTNIARYNRSVVERVKQTTSVLGKDGLFLGAFDGRGEMKIVCFLELLARLIEVSS